MKRLRNSIICLFLVLSVPFSNSSFALANSETADAKIKNIIFMIPDGGGMTAFNMADAVKQAGGFNSGLYPYSTPIEKGEMTIKEYWVGAEKTNNVSNQLTDSAAAGTALATGNKTVNNYVGINKDKIPVANLLEASQYVGKNTGIVVTYEWTNATPAAFSAHDISRSNMTTMSEQIVNQGIDVVLGGTHSAFSGKSWFADDSLKAKGYDIVKSKTDLNGVSAGDKLWGKFSMNLYYDTTSSRTSDIPTLAQMTNAAITALNDGNENGFFLMVEGSAVDGGGHSNNAKYMIGEYMAFDAACKVAIDFAKKRNDTVVVIAPDHDTGGMYWNEADLRSIVSQIQAGSATPTGLNWTGTGHTTWHGGVFIYAPDGVSYPNGIDPDKKDIALSEFAESNYVTAKTNLIENTEIANYLAKFIGVDLDELSADLFIDVTNLGTYNSSTEIFTFDECNAQVKRNEAKAIIDGKDIDLNGEIALYIEDKFYVPNSLYSKLSGVDPISYIDVSEMGIYDENAKVFKFNDYNASIKRNSNILVLNGKDIDMGTDRFIISDGAYFIPKKALEAIQRFTAGSPIFKIVADYNTKMVDVSGYITAPNSYIGMVAVNEGVELRNSISENDILLINESVSDYNGDFMTSFRVEEDKIYGRYTFNINYKENSAGTPVTEAFTFKHTIPTMLVETDNGDEIMYMDQLSAGDRVNVILKGFDFEDDFQGAIIVSQHNQQDQPVTLKVFPVVGGSADIGDEIEESVIVEEGIKTIKVMYWDWSTKTPVYSKYTISSKE